MGAKSRAISRHTGFMLPLNRLPSSPFQQSFHSFRPISPVFVVPSFPEKLSTSLFSLLSIGKHDEVQVIQPHNQQYRAGWHKTCHPAQYMAFIKDLVTCQYLIIALSLSLIVMEGLWSVFGEYELAYYGVNKEQMMFSLCLSYGAALLLGTFLGVLSDLIGHKKVCLIFCVLHLFVGVWKRSFAHPGAWLASICLSLASSIFSLSFETWMVIEHDKLGHRQDALNDMFWLMTFTDSASFIGSQVIANWLVHHKMETSAISPSNAVVLLAILTIIFVTRVLTDVPQTPSFKDYRRDFTAYIFGDKRVWVLAWAQACVQFSVAVFWILWAPTVVADGREVKLGLIYPCLLGARMLGSTVFPWFFTGPLSLRTEDFLVYVFIVMGFVLSVVAYDYQEIGVLVTLFCLFHACVGLILPSLARLRTMYIPNQLRGGMISLSLAPANAAILFFLLLRGYYQNIENSTILAFAALGLFSAAGCLHLLKRWGKQPNQNWHKP